jgi:citrate lyase subunit beta / citryl-CoA lyase
MRLRSLLFVPADSARKFVRAQTSGADALILDLEDSVAASQKLSARAGLAALIGQPRDYQGALFVRVNPLDSGLMHDDMAAVVQPGLFGLMIPKVQCVDDVYRISAALDPLEAAAGMVAGTVRIIIVATETPAALSGLNSYTPAPARLTALTWGAEDLAAATGATANRTDAGEWTFPYQMVRAQALFAAASAGVAPIDTLYADFRDTAGLARDSIAARRDGFTGRLAIHPDQIETINRCFSPTEQDVAHARKIVAAFAAQPDAGTLGIDGKMVDRPHLIAAMKILAASGES